MPARKTKKRKHKKRSGGTVSRKQKTNPPEESRPVETATIAWMLTCLIGLTAEVIASILLFVEWLFRNQNASEYENSIALLIAILAVMVSICLSPINLVLAGVLRKIRKEPPPAGILYIAIAIGLAPIPLVLIARTFAS